MASTSMQEHPTPVTTLPFGNTMTAVERLCALAGKISPPQQETLGVPEYKSLCHRIFGGDRGWAGPCNNGQELSLGRNCMLNVTVENIGDLAVVECEGKIVRSEAVLKLREAVTSQTDARIVVLALSEVRAIESAGLSMLMNLRRWARSHNIRFLLFNPSKSVRDGLTRSGSISEFYISTIDEMSALMVYANSRYALTG